MPLDGQLSGSKDELIQAECGLVFGRRMPQKLTPTLSPLGPPSDVRLGPLTLAMIAGAKWQGHDAFPAWQAWADDVETVFEFLDQHGRFATFQNLIQKTRSAQHRDAMLAEARGSFYLHRNGFKILEWEPLGEGTARGESMVRLGSSQAVFVEVKQPSWQGEHLPLTIADQNRLSLGDRAARLARMKQPRFLPDVCEGGAVGSHHFSMRVVRRNALHKFSVRQPNLALVVDDCNVTPVGLPSLAHYVREEFLHPAHDPLDQEDRYTYERLGGVLFLNTVSFGAGVEYNVDFVANPNVIPQCALPDEVLAAFDDLREDTERREETRYAGSNAFLTAMIDGVAGRSATNI